jgi:HPt (histidine-containing phosphotransfer) domain-containing protein
MTNIYATLRELQFDLEQLQQLSDHSLAFEQELLQIYLVDLQAQLQRLQQAVNAEDWPQVEQTTHHIKGASASVGAVNLSKLAEALEQAAKQAGLDPAAYQAGNAQRLLGGLICEFESMHQRLTPALLHPAGDSASNT